jgi:hypothetical protein
VRRGIREKPTWFLKNPFAEILLHVRLKPFRKTFLACKYLRLFPVIRQRLSPKDNKVSVSILMTEDVYLKALWTPQFFLVFSE